MLTPDDIAGLSARATAFDRVGDGYKARTIAELKVVEADIDTLIAAITGAIKSLETEHDAYIAAYGRTAADPLLTQAQAALRKAEICKSYVGFISHMKHPRVGEPAPDRVRGRVARPFRC